MTLQYVEGDATRPATPGPKIIVHVCNDIGKWGKGFVLAISSRWKAPEQAFKAAFASGVGRQRERPHAAHRRRTGGR